MRIVKVDGSFRNGSPGIGSYGLVASDFTDDYNTFYKQAGIIGRVKNAKYAELYAIKEGYRFLYWNRGFSQGLLLNDCTQAIGIIKQNLRPPTIEPEFVELKDRAYEFKYPIDEKLTLGYSPREELPEPDFLATKIYNVLGDYVGRSATGD